MPAIICPHCGVTNRAFSNFCNNCGADLREEQIDPNEHTVDRHGNFDPGALPNDELAPRIRQDRDPQTEHEPQGLDHIAGTSADQPAQPSSDPPEYVETFEQYDIEPKSPHSSDSAPQFDNTLPNVGESGEDEPRKDINALPRPDNSNDDNSDNNNTEDIAQPSTDTAVHPTFGPSPLDPLSLEETQTAEHIISDRLVSSIQGALRPDPLIYDLLDPLASEAVPSPNSGLSSADVRTATAFRVLDSIEKEDIRATMRMGALLENEMLPIGPPRGDTVRIPSIIWLLLGVLTIGTAFGITRPNGDVASIPSVAEAFTLVEELPQNGNVLVLWAYDPATAGEMDLVVQPILQHLIDKEAQLAVVSTLPMGPATVRRLWLDMTDQYTSINRAGLIDLGYLPGGAAAMPLMAYTDVLGILRYGVREFGSGSNLETFWQKPPAMMLVVAAQAEDLQHWLEQVQPLNGLPTLGVTAAAVSPIAQPYQNSGQLTGLVSGFDGATAYQNELMAQLIDVQQPERTFLLTAVDAQVGHLLAQNWGHLVLIMVILAGNLAHLLGGKKGT